MSFVQVGRTESERPTYFEVVAAERFVPTLRAAVVYSLAVYSQRHSWLNRLLEYEDEVLASLSFLLDYQSLCTWDSTFAESLYGLKRIQGARTRNRTGTGTGITSRDRLLTALADSLLPYLKQKADKYYKHYQPGQGVLGLALSHSRAAERTTTYGGTSVIQPPRSWQRTLLNAAHSAFLISYPYLHAGLEGTRFMYQLRYMLQPAQFYSPTLHALNQQIVRISPHDVSAVERRKAKRQQDRLAAAAAARTWPERMVRLAWAHTSQGMAEHARNSLILVVLLFKVLEWWYLSAEAKLSANQVLPPPPPPAAPKPSAAGVRLPDDPANCPVCRQHRTNPAVCAVSGYVFCYPCLFNAVMERGQCPVTLFPASLDHVRRLYEAT